MHQALIQDNSCDPGLETCLSAEGLELPERRKVRRLNSVQEFLPRRQHAACDGDGMRIVAAEQFRQFGQGSTTGCEHQFRFPVLALRFWGAWHVAVCSSQISQ